MPLKSFVFSGLVVTIAAVIAVAPVHAAPIARAAEIAAATIVDGLPSCSKPIMNEMVLRAPIFGCENVDGTPEVACLCRSRPFKRLAKEGVRAGCSEDADIGSTRRWAIDRCTAALTAANVARIVSRVTNDGIISNGTWLPDGASVATPADAAVRAPGLAPTEIKNTTMALPVAIFDLDDDEDHTAAAGMLRPAAGAGMLLAAVVSCAAVLF
ncbi:hypothetical protein L209DRAFT_780624 [Thermothelomyces heterothallicus CBS 203.75]